MLNVSFRSTERQPPISGRYGFETTFMAYFNQAYFDKELAWYTDRMSKSEPAPITPPNNKPFLFLVK